MAFSNVIKEMTNIKVMEFGKTLEKMAKKDFSKGKIYMDTRITDELKNEALLRELLREIQAERKRQGLVVTDRIVLTIDNEKMKKFEKDIKEKVEAVEIIYQQNDGKDVAAEELKARFVFKKV